MDTLGKLIGVIEHRFTVTNDAKVEVSITVKVDCTSASDADVRGWIVGNRTIAFQRPLKKLSASEISELDGTTIIAQDAGKKVKSRQEQIMAFRNAFMAAGVDESKAGLLAIAAVDNPAALAILDEEDENE